MRDDDKFIRDAAVALPGNAVRAYLDLGRDKSAEGIYAAARRHKASARTVFLLLGRLPTPHDPLISARKVRRGDIEKLSRDEVTALALWAVLSRRAGELRKE